MFLHNFAILCNRLLLVRALRDHQLVNDSDSLVDGVAQIMSNRRKHDFLFLLKLFLVVNLVGNVTHDHHDAGSVVPETTDKLGVEVGNASLIFILLGLEESYKSFIDGAIGIVVDLINIFFDFFVKALVLVSHCIFHPYRRFPFPDILV